MLLSDMASIRLNTLASLAACALVLLLCACSTSSEQAEKGAPAIAIDGVQIINKLSITVTDVQILVPLTGNFVSCGTILRQTACSTSFPGRQYERTPVQVSWKEQGQAHTTGDFVIEPPENPDPARSMWIEVVIFAPGQAGAKFVQHEQPSSAS